MLENLEEEEFWNLPSGRRKLEAIGLYANTIASAYLVALKGLNHEII